jgi:hypothetical protein
LVHDAAVAVAPVDEVPRPRRLPADHGTLAAIGRIAPDAGFLAMQQFGQDPAVGDIGWCRHHRMDQLGSAVDAEMCLHAEIPLVALLRLMHLGIARLGRILGRGRCIDDRRIDDRPGCNLQSLYRQMLLHLVERPLAQIMRFEQVAKAARRRLVRHRLAPEIDPDKTPHRQDRLAPSYGADPEKKRGLPSESAMAG